MIGQPLTVHASIRTKKRKRMILVPLTVNTKFSRMQTDKQTTRGDEEVADRNRQEPHDPVQAGKEAIEASKVAEGKPEPQQHEDEQKDAERWRNEG